MNVTSIRRRVRLSSDAGGVAEHTYTVVGDYSPVFKVTDDDGNDGIDTTQVTVHAGASPAVSAGGPYTTKMNCAIELIGTSSDADGEIINAGWDLDGDGTFEASGDTVSHTWTRCVNTW